MMFLIIKPIKFLYRCGVLRYLKREKRKFGEFQVSDAILELSWNFFMLVDVLEYGKAIETI